MIVGTLTPITSAVSSIDNPHTEQLFESSEHRGRKPGSESLICNRSRGPAERVRLNYLHGRLTQEGRRRLWWPRRMWSSPRSSHRSNRRRPHRQHSWQYCWTGGDASIVSATSASGNVKSKDEITLDLKLNKADGASTLAKVYKVKGSRTATILSRRLSSRRPRRSSGSWTVAIG